ncbi:RAMP superfamily CRISPR-associated protein [Nocardia sp. NPDC050697]|uniref:RAMP superfamily CRISPR-associated protein n=1 Tax=Nocardia sp. NPDC050697 TaxID=3155158 RepID=UPI0033FF441D
MTELRFRITFTAPVRVSSGRARPGVDAAIDMTDPLPATSLKGVMRATTTRLLGPGDPRIDAVFGSPRQPCRWEWSNATPDTEWAPAQRTTRIHVRDHVATEDMLAFTEQTHTPAAKFTVHTEHTLPEETAHIAVLTVAAGATRALGAGRRRGLGWVHITCESHPPGPELIRTFLTGGPP